MHCNKKTKNPRIKLWEFIFSRKYFKMFNECQGYNPTIKNYWSTSLFSTLWKKTGFYTWQYLHWFPLTLFKLYTWKKGGWLKPYNENCKITYNRFSVVKNQENKEKKLTFILHTLLYDFLTLFIVANIISYYKIRTIK